MPITAYGKVHPTPTVVKEPSNLDNGAARVTDRTSNFGDSVGSSFLAFAVKSPASVASLLRRWWTSAESRYSANWRLLDHAWATTFIPGVQDP